MTDVAFGMPDRPADEVIAYLGRLAGKLGLVPAAKPHGLQASKRIDWTSGRAGGVS